MRKTRIGEVDIHDSIDLVEFVLELEDAFGAEISDEDAEQIVTVKDAVDYIASHQG